MTDNCLVRIASKMTPDNAKLPVVVSFVPDPASGNANFRSTLPRAQADAFPLGGYVALSDCPPPDEDE